MKRRQKMETDSVAWVRERTTPTERPPSVSQLSAKFADRWCHVVSVTVAYGRILGILDLLFLSSSPSIVLSPPLSLSHTHTHTHTHTSVFSHGLPSRLVTASNGGSSLPSGLLNCSGASATANPNELIHQPTRNNYFCHYSRNQVKVILRRTVRPEGVAAICLCNSLSPPGASPAELMTTSHCLTLDYWVPFSSPLTAPRATAQLLLLL
jgi:hypothetical protein